jgi:peptidyl-prolyl cis-trans isomerase A (cyclophilin A)
MGPKRSARRWRAAVPGAIVLAAAAAVVPAWAENPKVAIRSRLGLIVVEVYADKAPVTAANFLRYVDAKLYDGTVFHRTVTLDNQPNDAVKIEVIQGGQMPAGVQGFPPIALERTSVTGLKHADGTISMARSGPDTATSSFFFCIGPQPELDFGGKRNKDGQGFAAFGKVVAGMDVVRKIQKAPAEGQTLKPPVEIQYVTRVTGPERLAVQHILIAFKGSIPEEKVTRTKEEAEALAKKLFEEARGGADFDALVKADTDDEYPGIYAMVNFGVAPDKDKKEYSRGGMVRSFGDVSFGLAVGAVGLAVYDPAFSKYGWHIIKRIR